MKQLIGQQIGQYQVEALLGEGGMGAVYRAHDLKHDRMVALKIMLGNLAHKPQFRSRFMQEADAIAHFSSPAIITVLDTGTYEESPYIVMEYIEGGSLINYMRQLDWSGAKPTVETVITIAAQVAEGLSYAHQRGLIHRDIKPGNVLLKMREGAYIPRQAVITDFGLAIQQKDGDEMDTAPFMGSLAYMSPEQCENKPLDGRSDIYALGILLYQLTTGQLPFKINAPADIVKHLDETPLPPSLINPDLPEILETIILKAMEKKPGDRYQSAAEMAHALRQALTNPELKTAVIAQQSSNAVTQWLDNKWVAAIDVEDRVDMHQTWTSLGKIRLFIVHQYEESKIVSLEKDEITVGREDSNDIVLEDQSVSGKHLRLVRTPQGWNVSDVGSTNHTYLGERILEYEQVYDWADNEPLRVGPYFLRWQPFEAEHREHHAASVLAGAALAGAAVTGAAKHVADDTPAAAEPTPSAETADLIPEYSDGEVLGIAITPPSLELDPGMQNILEISITNRDVTVKDISLRLEIEGRPPAWATLTDYQMKLLPDETASTTALVDLSQAPDILSGTHIIKLIATTDKGEMEFNDVHLIISSQEEFGLDMHPSNLQEKVTCRLIISDQSNFQNEYTIMGIDDSDALIFDFDEPQNAILAHFDEQQQQIKVAPRQEAWLGFRIRPRKRPLFGTSETLPFKIRVRTPNTEWQSLTGQVEISPRISRRLLLLFLLLMLLICGTGYLAFYQYSTVQAERYAELQGQLDEAEERAQQARAQVEAIDAEIEAAKAAGASEEEIAALEAQKAAAEAEQAAAEAAASAIGDEAATVAEEANIDTEATAAAEAAAAEAEATAIAESFTPTPEPNNPPTGIEFSGSSVKENVDIGTVIGEFTAVDPDSASAGGNTVVLNKSHLSRNARQSEEFTYTLVSGSGDTHNDYFAIEGNQLVTAADIDFEDVESLSFRVKVTDAAGDSFEKSFTLSVTDTDDIPQLSISDVTVSEADGTAEITVSVSGDNFDTATIDYATADGTAVAGTDYTTTSGTLTWDKGDTDSQTITVPLVDNEIDQVDRNFVVSLSNADKAIIDSGSATVTITDDDAEPTLTISDLTISEAVTGGKASITVELTGASSEAVTVDYTTADTTATAGDDYTATNGTLSWAAEATGSKTFDVTIIADDINETDESFLVILSGSENATISDSDATVTITDNNDTPKITIGDVTLTEGDTQISVPVTMTGKTSEEAWVEYSTSNGNGTTAATADNPNPDFDAASGRLTWGAGTEGEQTISIQVNDDDIDEVDQEFFVVSLYDNSTSVALQDTAGNVYINDDDDEPTISLENLSSSPVSESDSTVEADVTVVGRSSRPITLYYSTQNGTATAGVDYTAVLNGTITWPALDTSAQSIRITILDDETDESDEETFTLKLNSADNAQLGTDKTTSIIIQDNDPAPVISTKVSNNGEVDEDAEQVSVSVDIDRPSTQTITVTYTTVDGTSSASAIADVDYEAKTKTLTWNPGEEDPKVANINITDDAIFEGNETFIFRLASKSDSATIGTADTTLTIIDEDPAPIITIDSVSPKLESIEEDSPNVVVTLISDRQSSSAYTVDWKTLENSGVSSNLRAAAGSDYTSGSGTLTWPANSDLSFTQTFTMTLLEDIIDELDESFLLNLTSTLATIDDSADSTVITIQDNDDAPSITIDDLTMIEEDDIDVTLFVTMTGGSYQQITVPYTITNGTASTDTGDYTATATGTLTWVANITNTSQTITLSILEDFYDEDDETILVELGTVSPANAATLTNSNAIITITDDDVAGVQGFTPALDTINEDPDLTHSTTFTVSLDTIPISDVVMSFTATSTATDCTVSPTTATFSDTSVQTFTITAVNNEIDDVDPNNCTIETAITDGDTKYIAITPNDVTVTIINDDIANVVVSDPVLTTIDEDPTGTNSTTFTVSLGTEPISAVDMSFTPSSTATDCTVSPTTATFSDQSAQTFTITAVDNEIDDVDPNNCTILIAITSSGSDYTAIDPTDPIVAITDDDVADVVVSNPVLTTIDEDPTGTTSTTFTVNLATIPTDAVTISFATTSTSTTTECSVTPTPATFSNTNAQTFTITADDDDIDDENQTCTIQTTIISDDPAYGSITQADFSVTVTDNDVAVVQVTQPDTTTIYEDPNLTNTTTFTVSLATTPISAVGMSFTPSSSECSVAPTTQTFTDTSEQTFTITATDDDVDDGDLNCTVVTAITSSGSDYDAINPDNVIVTVINDDTAGVQVTQPGTTTIDEDPSLNNTTTFTVSLNTVPISDVVMSFTPSSSECSVAPTTQTFTNTSDQTFTITATDDDIDDDDQPCTIETAITSSGSDYPASAQDDVTITVTDDDSAGFTLSPETLTVIDSNGMNSDTFTVTLNSEPANPVTLTFVSTNECTVSTPTALNSSNYGDGVPVTVTGDIDNIADGDATCVVTASSISTTDPAYSLLTTTDVGTVTVTVEDDESADFILSTNTLTVVDSTGSNTADFTVTLNSQPTSAVNLTFASTGECTVSTPSALTSGNYDTGVSVTVTGVVDDIADGDATCEISASTITGDTTYVDLGTTAVGTVTVTVSDDDTPGFTLSTTTLSLDDSTGSNTGTFTVTLNSEPASDVTISFTNDNPTECTNVSVNSPFVLNSSNYQTGVSVTVTGKPDDVVDGNTVCNVSANSITGDTVYAALPTSDVGEVVVTINNDDAVGVTVLPTTLTLSETITATNNSDTFLITLGSEPSSGVRIDLGTSNAQCTAEALANSPIDRANFNSTNWQTGIIVTVTAADDTTVEGTHTCNVTMTVSNAQSADEYDNYLITDVVATIMDDDS